MKELWDTIAGGDIEGEAEEIEELFRKKKKIEKTPREINHLVQNIMAVLEVTAEEDAELNRQNKPAVSKLKKLSWLTEVLSKKQLQREFLDHGLLTILKIWLEPLPDGSLVNMNVRTVILKILTDFPLELNQSERREQLKESGLGKVIMFLWRTPEESRENKKLAENLVQTWSRLIFNKSTSFDNKRNYYDESRPSYPLQLSKKPGAKAVGLKLMDDDLNFAEFSQSIRNPKSRQSSLRQRATKPEALPMDFAIHPSSKIDPDEVRAQAKQITQEQSRFKINKKLQQLKKKKQLQAIRLSARGHGM